MIFNLLYLEKNERIILYPKSIYVDIIGIYFIRFYLFFFKFKKETIFI